MLHVPRDRHSALFSQVPLWVTQDTGLCWSIPRTRQSEAGQEVYGTEGQRTAIHGWRPHVPCPPTLFFVKVVTDSEVRNTDFYLTLLSLFAEIPDFVA